MPHKSRALAEKVRRWWVWPPIAAARARPESALGSMLLSMHAGLVVMVALYCVLSILTALLCGCFSPAGIAALAVVDGLIVLTAPGLLSASGTSGSRRWPPLAAWQALAFLTVLVSAWYPPEAVQRMPSDYVLRAAGAVTAFRATMAGHGGMLALIGGSAMALHWLSGTRPAVMSSISHLLFYGLMVAVFRIISVSADRADRTIERLVRAERVASVVLAVRRDRVDRMRVLHDTVLATLTAVAQGIATDDHRARARFAADLERLSAPGLLSVLSADGPAEVSGPAVASALDRTADDAAAWGLSVHVEHVGTPRGWLSAASAEALVGGVSEALTNVRRHSGVRTARASVRWDGHQVRAMVRDTGQGFDSGGPAGRRIGLRESVAARATAAGGHAHVDSVPGAGTTVEIVVPVHDPDAGSLEVG